MKRIISIWKTIAKTSGGYGVLSESDKSRQVISRFAIAGLGIFLFSVLYKSMYNLFADVAGSGIEPYIFYMYIISVTTLIITYGVFDFMGIFYFAEDLKWYLHLPIKPYVTILIKLGIMYSHQILLASMVLPLFVSYGVLHGMGPLYYLAIAVVLVLMPVIPCTISGLMAMTLMRFSPGAKNKDVFKVIVGTLSVFMGVGINVILRQAVSSKAMASLLQKYGDVGKEGWGKVEILLTPYKTFILGVVENKGSSLLLGILILFVSTLVLLGLLILVGSKVYTKSIMGLDEKSVSKKQKNKHVNFKNTSLLTTLIKCEIRAILREPNILVQYVITPLILPSLIIFMQVSDGDLNLTNFNDDLSVMAFFGMMLFIAFMTIVSPVFYTAISREGSNFINKKYLPICHKAHCKSKVIVSVLIGLETVVVLIGVMVYLKISIDLILAVALSMTSVIIFASVFGLHIDMSNPNLQWNNLNELFKRNDNIWGMLIGCATMAIVMLVITVIYNIFSGNLLVLSASYALTLLVISGFGLGKIMKGDIFENV